ncbi:MAG: ABC transporter substrate-binding protein [Thermodesulfobacteriota bacterium]|nr:ABC transporter substrate-binding protein [Thermodesulfobacteriota bacterium]
MKKLFILLLGLLLCAGAVNAKTLKIGMSSDARSMDPFFHNETVTNSMLSNIFEGLTYFDAELNVYPMLAESWQVVGDNTWEFKLKKGIKFHNGNAFNADDVIFSIDRVKNWAKSGFKSNVNMIKSFVKVDDYTVQITTKGPYPILLRKLTYIKMLDSEYCADKDDAFLGLNPVGTGPYKFVAWRKGESLTLKSNPDYWRAQPHYSEVIFKPLTNNATRVAAVLSGEVDIVDKVPVMDVRRIKKATKLNFFMQPGLRLIYLQMDQGRLETPYVEGKNPFLDVRVRKAVYLGINENAIVKHVMKGFAKPAGQFHPDVVFGYDDSIKRPAHNIAQAKKLLKDAGYPNGFEVTLDAPNNRYVNDAQIAQAIASSLSRVGITVKVNALPKSNFFPKTDRLDTSFFLIGWASTDGDGSSFLDGIVHTHDNEKGYGRYNRGRYSNPKVDELIEKSGLTVDPQERLGYLIEAQRIALVEDMNIIPLHFQVDLYASGKNVKFVPRADNHMYVYDIK